MGFQIKGQLLSADRPPFIIAELSANHGGSLERAKSIIKLAKQSGADAVKIQSYEPHTITLDSNEKDFLIEDGLWKGQSLYTLYSDAFTPFKWHQELFDYAKEEDIILFSSPFDETAVDLLEELDTPAYKIASFELCDLALITKVAKTHKPILMSTGLSNMHEIEQAVKTARENGAHELLLFHCISSYPAEAKDSCLHNISILREKFDLLVGLSDHTIDNTASIVATTLGACAIEKHFTDSRLNGGVDSTFSIEPKELEELKRVTSDAWLSIKHKEFRRPQCEEANIKFKRSIYFCEDLKVGQRIKLSSIRVVRPGYGLEPKYFEKILGSRLVKPASHGQRVTWEHFADS